MHAGEDAISKLESAVAETQARLGDQHLDVSYRLDDLAAALKQAGRALDSANAAARARAIRARAYGQDASQQDERFGVAASQAPLSAGQWLCYLHRCSIVAAGVLSLLSILPWPDAIPLIYKEGAACISGSTLVQLLLFPLKAVPRPLKWVVVSIAGSLIWAFVERFH